jgi:hypothetical protein
VIDDKLTQFLSDQFPGKSPNVEMHRGSTIDNNFIAVKTIVVTFLDFPDLDKVHQASVIDNFFMSFVNVYLSCISLMPKGINYLSHLYANNLCKPNHLLPMLIRIDAR